MSAWIQVGCDAAINEYGTCPARDISASMDWAKARKKFLGRGWIVSEDGSQCLCPRHAEVFRS